MTTALLLAAVKAAKLAERTALPTGLQLASRRVETSAAARVGRKGAHWADPTAAGSEVMTDDHWVAPMVGATVVLSVVTMAGVKVAGKVGWTAGWTVAHWVDPTAGETAASLVVLSGERMAVTMAAAKALSRADGWVETMVAAWGEWTVVTLADPTVGETASMSAAESGAWSVDVSAETTAGLKAVAMAATSVLLTAVAMAAVTAASMAVTLALTLVASSAGVTVATTALKMVDLWVATLDSKELRTIDRTRRYCPVDQQYSVPST